MFWESNSKDGCCESEKASLNTGCHVIGLELAQLLHHQRWWRVYTVIWGTVLLYSSIAWIVAIKRDARKSKKFSKRTWPSSRAETFSATLNWTGHSPPWKQDNFSQLWDKIIIQCPGEHNSAEQYFRRNNIQRQAWEALARDLRLWKLIRWGHFKKKRGTFFHRDIVAAAVEIRIVGLIYRVFCAWVCSWERNSETQPNRLLRYQLWRRRV